MSKLSNWKMSDEEAGDPKENNDVAVIEKVKEPSLYKVLLHNDDYTTMEFVVYILQIVFGKDTTEAASIMMEVHEKGTGVCGIYTYEVAETKVSKVMQLARKEKCPLKCSMEEE